MERDENSLRNLIYWSRQWGHFKQTSFLKHEDEISKSFDKICTDNTHGKVVSRLLALKIMKELKDEEGKYLFSSGVIKKSEVDKICLRYLYNNKVGIIDNMRSPLSGIVLADNRFIEIKKALKNRYKDIHKVNELYDLYSNSDEPNLNLHQYIEKLNCARFQKKQIENLVKEDLTERPLDVANRLLKEYSFKYAIQNYKNGSLDLVDNESKKIISQRQLSSGESTFLTMLSWLFSSRWVINEKFYRQRSRCLLLDEFDRHLDPDLCKLMMRFLKDELVDTFGFRVVLTTHRVDTLSLAPPDGLFQIRTQACHKEITPIHKLTAFFRMVKNFRGFIDYHHKVYVEGKDDETFFQGVYETLREKFSDPRHDEKSRGEVAKDQKHICELNGSRRRLLSKRYQLRFYGVHSGQGKYKNGGGGCSKVKEAIQRNKNKVSRIFSSQPENTSLLSRRAKRQYMRSFLDRQELYASFGIIDYDNLKTRKITEDIVVCRERHSLENFIFDPILLAQSLSSSSKTESEIAEECRKLTKNTNWLEEMIGKFIIAVENKRGDDVNKAWEELKNRINSFYKSTNVKENQIDGGEFLELKKLISIIKNHPFLKGNAGSEIPREHIEALKNIKGEFNRENELRKLIHKSMRVRDLLSKNSSNDRESDLQSSIAEFSNEILSCLRRSMYLYGRPNEQAYNLIESNKNKGNSGGMLAGMCELCRLLETDSPRKSQVHYVSLSSGKTFDIEYPEFLRTTHGHTIEHYFLGEYTAGIKELVLQCASDNEFTDMPLHLVDMIFELNMRAMENDRRVIKGAGFQKQLSNYFPSQFGKFGLKIIPLKVRQNNFFSAVGQITKKSEEELREMAANYLESNPTLPESYSERPSAQDAASSIREGKFTHEKLTIFALSQTLNRSIIILDGDGHPVNMTDASEVSDDPIFVFKNGASHYDALEVFDESLVDEFLKSLRENSGENLPDSGSVPKTMSI